MYSPKSTAAHGFAKVKIVGFVASEEAFAENLSTETETKQITRVTRIRNCVLAPRNLC